MACRQAPHSKGSTYDPIFSSLFYCGGLTLRRELQLVAGTAEGLGTTFLSNAWVLQLMRDRRNFTDDRTV